MLPFGPLKGFITEEIDQFLDVKHLKDFFIVDNYKDQCTLIEAANSCGISVPELITYDFKSPLIEEAQHELLPVPVMNVLMDYSKKVIVSKSGTFGDKVLGFSAWK